VLSQLNTSDYYVTQELTFHILRHYATFVIFVTFNNISSGKNAVSLQVFHNIDVAPLSCHCSALGRAVNAMSSQISNNLKMSSVSCPISALRCAMDAVSSQIADNL
jgi:hypothetical protein